MERSAESFLETPFVKDFKKALAPAKVSAVVQSTVQRVHCPNCGGHAERFRQQEVERTQCSRCDYLMTICTETGRVMEAYAPSFTPAAIAVMA